MIIKTTPLTKRFHALAAAAILTVSSAYAQTSTDMYVCFYSAPVEKTINIMHDVYQGVAHSSDNGATWESLSYITSLMHKIARHPESGDLYLASEYGLLRSTDKGASWKQLTGWDIQSVFTTVFLGTNIWIATPNGPYVSHNNGTTWERKTSGLKPLNATYTSDMAIVEGTLVISTSDGIYMSSDQGASWKKSGLQGTEIDKLVQHPSNPARIAALSNGKGLWMSNDGGASWLPKNGDLYSKNVQAFAFHPTEENVYYAGMSDYPICKTTDGGKKWITLNRNLTNNDITSIAIDPDNPSTIYAGSANGLWVSVNGGEKWDISNIHFGYINSVAIMR